MVKILIRWWWLCILILFRIKQKLSVFPGHRKTLREANFSHKQFFSYSFLKDWDAWSWHSVLSLGMLSTEFSMALRRMMRVVQDLERLPLLLFNITVNGPGCWLCHLYLLYITSNILFYAPLHTVYQGLTWSFLVITCSFQLFMSLFHGWNVPFLVFRQSSSWGTVFYKVDICFWFFLQKLSSNGF